MRDAFFMLGLLAFSLAAATPALAAGTGNSFTGTKSSWHGFTRYDFMMDARTLAIHPIKSLETNNSIGAPPAGMRRCVIVCPNQPAAGNPWSWRGCYWDHQPQAEVELLKRGFYIAYISASGDLPPDQCWGAWYNFLTEHGLSKFPAFIGMSRGGMFALTWATMNPDKVSCIYGDNPAVTQEAVNQLDRLAKNDVPLLFVCGSIDPLLRRCTDAIENIYQQFGGRVSVMIKEGASHHPHSLNDPKPIADFIQQSVREASVPVPDFIAGHKSERSSYYSNQNTYEKVPEDGFYITRRGPMFSPCYNLYELSMGFAVAVNIIEPNKEAPGRPWVYRAGFVARDAVVDQALLAKGYHIVVGPIEYTDGPTRANWDKVYAYLIAHGFSKKPVMEGEGGGASAVYEWAIENPDKVACIYAENPVLQTTSVKIQPLDNLAPLAKAGIPIMHVYGSDDPAMNDQGKVAEQKYQALGGKITTQLLPGQGHFLNAGRDIAPAVDFILNH